MKNTVFIIGGLALLGFALWRRSGQTTGSNAAPGTPAQTNPATPQGGGNVINPNGLTQEQANALAQQTALNNLNGAIITPWLPASGVNVPWAVQGGNGGGFLLPF